MSSHIDDIGTIIRATIVDQDGAVVDVSGATVKQINILKPSGGDLVTVDAEFVTDGVNGQIQYTCVDGDLDETGIYQTQGYVVLPEGAWRSDIEKFTVKGNLG